VIGAEPPLEIDQPYDVDQPQPDGVDLLQPGDVDQLQPGDVDQPLPVRRSERTRRQSSLLRDYEVIGNRNYDRRTRQVFEDQGLDEEDDVEIETDSREGNESGEESREGNESGEESREGNESGEESREGNESGEESEYEGDSNSTEELPEIEPRFMTYNPPVRNHNVGGDAEEESAFDDDEISLIAEREFIEENRIELREQPNELREQPNNRIEDHMIQPQHQPRVKYNSRNTVAGTDNLTHIELSLICVHHEMQSENVKIGGLNFTTLARAARDRHQGSFPTKSVPQIAKYIRSILTKARRNFESDTPILPRNLRANDDRIKRMEDCISNIIRMDSAAPEPITRHINTRGVARRPRIVERPVIPAPGVGRIAPGVGRIAPGVGRISPGVGRIAPGVGRIAPGVGRIAPTVSRTDAEVPDGVTLNEGGTSQPDTSRSGRTQRAGSAVVEMGDTQDNYLEERRRRQEQGAELREQSLGLASNTRVTNNRRLGQQLDQFSNAIQTLSDSRQTQVSSSSYLANINRRQDNRERSRSMEREERRTMDLLLVAHATNNKELASSVSVGKMLTVFKKVEEENIDLSPDFPITLKLTDITQMTRELKEYLEVAGAIAGIVIKDRNNHKTIVTSADMVVFSEATVETIVKRDKQYILLTEK